ncbi:hypothetical protein EV361DRAFT_998651 [Lentinula raphanica]|nr:hypothetical protein EV361DRAFT_998651 [Lentinula raphanica]
MCSWLKLPLDRKDFSVATHSETELTTARTRLRSSYAYLDLAKSLVCSPDQLRRSPIRLKNGKRTTFELPRATTRSLPISTNIEAGSERESSKSVSVVWKADAFSGRNDLQYVNGELLYGNGSQESNPSACTCNLFDRVFTLLPRVDKLSHHHVHLEELVQNVPAEDIMGTTIGMCSREKLLKGYIARERFEKSLEFDRVRRLYEDHLHRAPRHRNDPQFDPANFSAWIKYAKIEIQSEDFTHNRAIINLEDFSRGRLTLTLKLETQDRQGKPLGRSVNDFSLSGPLNHSNV